MAKEEVIIINFTNLQHSLLFFIKHYQSNFLFLPVRSSSTSPALEDKEYIGGVPVVSFRDGSGSPSSVPQLPHIPGAIPLTPIGEASREQTTVVPLPPIGGKGDISVFLISVLSLCITLLACM